MLEAFLSACAADVEMTRVMDIKRFNFGIRNANAGEMAVVERKGQSRYLGDQPKRGFRSGGDRSDVRLHPQHDLVGAATFYPPRQLFTTAGGTDAARPCSSKWTPGLIVTCLAPHAAVYSSVRSNQSRALRRREASG